MRYDRATRSYACDIAAYIIIPTVEQVQMCVHNITCAIGLGKGDISAFVLCR